jgi:hypothetical protein
MSSDSEDVDKELAELDKRYGLERQAILLKSANKHSKTQGQHGDKTTKILLKQLVLNRVEEFNLRKKINKANHKLNTLRSSLSHNDQSTLRLSVRLAELDPTRCMECGAPHHDHIGCEDFTDFDKPITSRGNRFWWDVPFTDQEVTAFDDYSVGASDFYRCLKEKNKAYPIDPEILTSVDAYEKLHQIKK